MPDRTPDPSQPPLESPIGICPRDCEAVVVVPAPLPDTLAETGPTDVAAAALGALVLLYAGLALLGRPTRRHP